MITGIRRGGGMGNLQTELMRRVKREYTLYCSVCHNKDPAGAEMCFTEELNEEEEEFWRQNVKEQSKRRLCCHNQYATPPSSPTGTMNPP